MDAVNATSSDTPEPQVSATNALSPLGLPQEGASWGLQHPAAQKEAGSATEVPNTVRIMTQTPRQKRELPGAAVQMLERSRQVTIIILAVCVLSETSE